MLLHGETLIQTSDVNEDKVKKIMGNVKFISVYDGLVDDNESYTIASRYSMGIVPCGFDIETTYEFMYIWTMTINNTTIVGYTWEDFRHLLATIKKAYKLGKQDGKLTKVIPIFVHCFADFEYKFMRSEVNFTREFKINGEVYTAIIDDSFYVLDSYKICPSSLETVAKLYSKVEKLVGELDYEKERNHTDARNMSEMELKYCINDTVILKDFAKSILNEFAVGYGCIPYSQNSIIKIMLKHEFRDKYEKNKYMNLLKDIALTKEMYARVRKYGANYGWCQSSDKWVLGPVDYHDIDAAYAGAFIHDYFPMSKYRPVPLEDWKKYLTTHCCQLVIRFYGLRAKSFVRPATRGHVIFENVHDMRNTEVSGAMKIRKCPKCVVSVNELEFYIYTLCYDWDEMEILSCDVAERGQLPDVVKRLIVKLYEPKAKMKAAGLTDTPEYGRIKSRPSTVFGCASQKMYDDDMKLSDYEWKKKILSRILPPQWGVYVASHVRFKLMRIALELGVDLWLYTDTDSLYNDSDPRAKLIFAKYNDRMRQKNEAFCEEYDLDYEIFKNLGTFDDESRKNLKIDAFSTLSEKTYLYHYTDIEHPNGAWKLVLSGCPAKAFWDAYDKEHPLDYDHKNVEQIIKFFKANVIVEYTKNIAVPVENTSRMINGELMTCKTGVRIEKRKIIGQLRMLKATNALSRIKEAYEDPREMD